MIPAQAVEAAADAFIEHGTLLPALEAAAPHMLAPILALMDDPEHYDSRGPSNGYVSVDNLRAAMGLDNAR